MNKPRTFKKVLITGISGSGGSYLAEYIVKNLLEVKVHGLARWHTSTVDNLKDIRNKITMHEVDMTDLGSVIEVLKRVKPDGIINLAAYANVLTSFKTPTAVMYNNVMSTNNLFEAVRILGINPVIQHCSTSEVYGKVDPKHVPITEETPFKPASPYAVSKTAQDMIAWNYFIAYKLPVFRTRMFTYLNPRRTDIFATAWAKQVAWIEQGLQKELVHGNLDSVRTMIDVRDAMRAYWEAMLYCVPGEVYNIGGTTTMKVGEFLEILKSLSTVNIPSRVDPSLLRPADVTLQIPAVDKFTKTTKWKPEYKFEESIKFVLDYWRKEALLEKQRING
jgi:GDP-4-dehydro-6-deoxy-D-mannose reductase